MKNQKTKKEKSLWIKKFKKERMSAMDILFSIYDNVVDILGDIGDHAVKRVSLDDVYNNNHFQPSDIRQQLYYLKKKKLIKSVIKSNKNYLEITKEGYRQLTWKNISIIKNDKKWDKNFRLVMFDIPENKRNIRDMVRDKLKEIGFIQIQKSVFIYPYECKQQIDALCYWCSAGRFIKYMVVKITEGEEDIIAEFLDQDILTLDDLK